MQRPPPQEVVIVSGTSQHLRKPALLVVLIAIVGLGAASAMAAVTAVSAAKPFELVLNGEAEWDDFWGVLRTSEAFTSKAPFCESGSAVDVDIGVRRFVCADGSGSITLDIGFLIGDGDWSILEATGQYAGLRGRGTFRSEALSEDEFGFAFRTTYQGVADADAVAPTIAVANLKASKVKGKKGLYTIPVALDIRDNVGDNPVTYRVIVRRETDTGPWLASKSGEAIGGISFELRVRRPNERVRAVLIRTTAMDPVGNESSLDAWVKLPK
jgi:hypothetical protein